MIQQSAHAAHAARVVVRPRAASEDRAVTHDSLARFLQDLQHERHAVISRQEEEEIGRRAREGDVEARQELVNRNVRFVLQTAFARTRRGCRASVQELVAAGCYGLVQAAAGFDERMGVRFLTYAVRFINDEMAKAAEEAGSVVRVTRHARSQLRELRRVESDLRTALGREPRIGDLAQRMGRSVEAVLEIRAADVAVCSIDAPSGEGSASGWGVGAWELPLIENAGVELREAQRQRRVNARGFIQRMLTEGVTDARMRLVLVLWSGMDRLSQECRSLEEVAAEIERFGFPRITRERVRQIKDRAVGVLRSWCDEHLSGWQALLGMQGPTEDDRRALAQRHEEDPAVRAYRAERARRQASAMVSPHAPIAAEAPSWSATTPMRLAFAALKENGRDEAYAAARVMNMSGLQGFDVMLSGETGDTLARGAKAGTRGRTGTTGSQRKARRAAPALDAGALALAGMVSGVVSEVVALTLAELQENGSSREGPRTVTEREVGRAIAVEPEAAPAETEGARAQGGRARTRPATSERRSSRTVRSRGGLRIADAVVTVLDDAPLGDASRGRRAVLAAS